MKSEDWKTLSVLFQTKNLTQSARQLYISQPALTIRLQNMERELGCQIALRSNKGLLFTPEGEYLAKQAVKITTLIDQSLRHVKTIQGQSLGTIKLLAPSTFFRYFLLDLLRAYQQICPDTRFQVEVVNSSEAAERVNRLDAYGAFVHGDYCDILPKFKLASMPAYAVSREPITLEELAAMPLIAHDTTQKTQKMIQSWWRATFDTEMDVQMSVKNIDICLHMIESGFGAGIVFGDFFLKDYQLYTLPLTLPDGTPFTRDVWFIYAKELAGTPLMSAFLEYLQSCAPFDCHPGPSDQHDPDPARGQPDPEACGMMGSSSFG